MFDINSHNKNIQASELKTVALILILTLNSRWVNVLFASSVAADCLTFQTRNLVLPLSEIHEIIYRVGFCISTVGEG